MTQIVLGGGAYQSRALIAGAQRCVNLYPERNPPDGNPPVPVTHYPTPGLRRVATAPNVAAMRCLYTATNGDLYAVVGSQVYYVDPTFAFWLIGAIGDYQTPVRMADNGQKIMLVDGTSDGFVIDMVTRAFGLVDPGPGGVFYGSTGIGIVDTFFIFNNPGTRQWYISMSQDTTFDPLDLAAKTGAGDPVVTVMSAAREAWIFGSRTTEVWYNAGTPDFTFAPVPGAFIEHGCAAAYSVAEQDGGVFWLSQDYQGYGIVLEGRGAGAKRVSTTAIEAAIQGYDRIDDAIGFCYQQQGHSFYVLTFPDADKTWAYELSTQQWHEWASTGPNGELKRHRANCCAAAYGQNLVGDWQNGNLYALDPTVLTDNGSPIIRVRTFPHLVTDGKRQSFLSFIANMEVGNLGSDAIVQGVSSGGGFDNNFDSGFLHPVSLDQVSAQLREPLISLRWSDTRGRSWGNPVVQSLGRTGEYLASVKWNRLGMARDRVFELSWSSPMLTALNGAFIEAQGHAS